MAVDKFPKLKELTLKYPERGILSFVADGPIAMWAPVVIVAPAAGETLPRVDTTTSSNDVNVIGIAAGGSGDVAGTGNAADAAGDVVDVIPIHSAAITKVVVNAVLSLGALVGTTTVAGRADAASATTPSYVLGKLFQLSSTIGDTVLIFMGGSK